MARTYLVLDLPHSSADSTALLNKHASHDWTVICGLTWGNGDAGVIMERHTTRHQDAVALAETEDTEDRIPGPTKPSRDRRS